MWTPTTPTRTPALLNIDKQSQKGKKNNKHKSSWLHSGCFGEKFLTVKEAAAILQANKQCLERSLSINAPLTYLSANIYHDIGEAATPPKQTRSPGDWIVHRSKNNSDTVFSISMAGYVSLPHLHPRGHARALTLSGGVWPQLDSAAPPLATACMQRVFSRAVHTGPEVILHHSQDPDPGNSLQKFHTKLN